MLKINEIFFSIQGESSYAGAPTVFVRTSGCHLRCHYCDTTYAFYEGEKKSLDTIMETIESFGAQYVCLTGGEPLLQKRSLDLLRLLCDKGYHVSLETSGSISCEGVDSRVKKVLDVKTPDSGAADTFALENLRFLTVKDELKFVICSENDFLWSENFVKHHDLAAKCFIFFSPSFGKIEPRWLAEKIIEKKSPARLHLQLHKYIWSPGARGV